MKRLVEGGGSELERGLLDSLRLERPSAALEQRMRDALGLGPIPATVPTTSAAPVAKTSAGWGSIAAGSVVAVLFVGGALLVRNRPPVETQTPTAPVKIVTPSEPVQPAPTPAVTPEPRAPETVAPQATPKPRPQPAHAVTSASLREEIRLIDSARVAVKNDEASRAIGILDQYARRFPDGAFLEEARLLRAEAQKKR